MFDRYIKLMAWARERYTVDGVLTVMIGNQPTAYTRIEQAAAAKFLGATI
jgi:hypothetical protein